jgi:PAS domain S-box-containing protein
MNTIFNYNIDRRIIDKSITFGFLSLIAFLPVVVFISLKRINESQMSQLAVDISQGISSIRDFYRSDVVERIQKSQGKIEISENYKNIEGGIPIPATFSIEIGSMFSKAHKNANIQYKFVSDFPFPGRKLEPLDSFQKAAINNFRSDNQLTVAHLPNISAFSETTYRLATPIKMQDSCVNCHNNHPQSPKKDWQVGDVRGIQEVYVGSGRASLKDIEYIIGYVLSFLLFGSSAVVYLRRSTAKLSKSNDDLFAARELERKTAKELRNKLDQVELLGAVVDRSTFGVTITNARDPENPIVYANDAFLSLTGYTKEEVIGRNCRFLRGLETEIEALNRLRNAIAAGMPATVELLNYRKNGTAFWNRLTIFPIGAGTTGPDYYVGYQVDITELRAAEEQRKIMLTEIQESKKMESLGILIAGVSHEINNPLGIALTATTHIINNATSTMRILQSKNLLTPELKEYFLDEQEGFKLVDENLKRAIDLVRSFKEVSVDRAHSSLRKIKLKTYLETLTGSFLPLLRRSRCQLTLNCPEEIVITTEPSSLGQIITNLVVNSTVHAFEGIKSPEITIKAFLCQEEVTIIISDNGRGIPADIQHKIFEPFFTTRRNNGGTGLGLFIVSRIVQETLKGHISCESNEGSGTAFTLQIPSIQEPTEIVSQ